MKFLIALLLIAFGANSVYAADTYDATTGRLTIPLVRAYGNVYRDVVIQIGDVVAVNGGSAIDSLDSYDSATNQLSIPSVTAFGTTYTNVVIKVGSVVSVGWGAVTDLNTSPMEQVSSIDLLAASGYSGKDILFYNLLTKGDINGDGYDDLIIGLFRHTTNPSYSGRQYDPSGEIKPVILFYDAKSDSYKVNNQLQSTIQTVQHPRQAVIADLDGDGRVDIFIQDHGYDDAPYGNRNILTLNKKTGWEDGTYLLPQLTDFSHGSVVADFDNNGKPDLLVLNNLVNEETKCTKYSAFKECTYNYPKNSESYILFNNGTAGLTKGTFNISDEVINFKSTSTDQNLRLYVGYSSDFNKDGKADLVISNLKYVYILESTSNLMNFSPSQIIEPLKYFSKCDFTPASAITSLDLDGDGKEEIIISQACGLNTAYFRIFKRTPDGIWEEKTDTFIPDQTRNTDIINDGWCYKFEKADLNNDGKLDLICQSTRGTGPDSSGNVFWINEGGKLRPAGIALQDGIWSNFHTKVKSKNGEYILGFKDLQGLLKITRWKN